MYEYIRVLMASWFVCPELLLLLLVYIIKIYNKSTRHLWLLLSTIGFSYAVLRIYIKNQYACLLVRFGGDVSKLNRQALLVYPLQ